MAVPDAFHGLDYDELEREVAYREHDDDDTSEEEVLEEDFKAVKEAAESGNVEALRLALDNLNGSIDQSTREGDTALHLACLYGHIACVQLLLERRASPDSKDEDEGIPLHDACAGGFTVIVEALLNAAENRDHLKRLLDTADVDGDTPLHHAARGAHLEVVQLLLGVGACPNIPNALQKKPVDLVDPDTEVWRVLDSVTTTDDNFMTIIRIVQTHGGNAARI